MAADFRVISTQKYTYQDDTNRLVDGFKVFFYLPAFDETHYIFVPSLAKDSVTSAIMKLVNDRKLLATI